ncbi:MAG: helix-turn-helix domain-containing protein [Desulfobulbaceae bacterium]|nr:helix-turn-helix domain-containing protein [Desulfobulbaceae bacterium]
MKTYKKHITQKEIAQLAHIQPDFLSHIVRGRRRCPPAVAVRLEEVTGIERKLWVWGDPKDIRQELENYLYSKPINHGH